MYHPSIKKTKPEKHPLLFLNTGFELSSPKKVGANTYI